MSIRAGCWTFGILVLVSRFLIGADWDDVPHLTDDAKASLLASIPKYQQDARTKGIPQLGAGAIYPIPESSIRINDIPIPDHWRRGFGMDVGGGAKPTAAAFFAFDPENATYYVTGCYKAENPEPTFHASMIKGRMGGWKWPGVGDAAALILTEHDSEQLVSVYRRLDLDLSLADKSVETGIKEVYDLMVAGRFKVFASCVAWFAEFRMYQRDKHGRIKKTNDHLMDSTRYRIRAGWSTMKVKPVVDPKEGRTLYVNQGEPSLDWMST